jgi:hypothetical protein
MVLFDDYFQALLDLGQDCVQIARQFSLGDADLFFWRVVLSAPNSSVDRMVAAIACPSPKPSNFAPPGFDSTGLPAGVSFPSPKVRSSS